MYKKISKIVSFQSNLTLVAGNNVFSNLGTVLFGFNKNVKVLQISAQGNVLNGVSSVVFTSVLGLLENTGARIMNYPSSVTGATLLASPNAQIIHNTNYPATFQNLEIGGLSLDFVWIAGLTAPSTSIQLVFFIEVEEEVYIPDPVV